MSDLSANIGDIALFNLCLKRQNDLYAWIGVILKIKLIFNLELINKDGVYHLLHPGCCSYREK